MGGALPTQVHCGVTSVWAVESMQPLHSWYDSTCPLEICLQLQ
jgi:hypothetical protein